MKKITLIILLGVLVAGITFAQSRETRSISSFSKISVHEVIDVHLQKGDKEEVEVISENNIPLEEILTDVKDGKLKIHLKGIKWKEIKVKVYVTYKSLNAITSVSSSSVTARETIDAKGNNFNIDVNSTGYIDVKIKNIDELSVEVASAGEASLIVEANNVTADVESAGEITILGKVKKQTVEAGSGGGYKGYGLISEEAVVKASSAGSIKISVSDKIRVRANSGGSVWYKGNPTYTNTHSNSGGTIKKM